MRILIHPRNITADDRDLRSRLGEAVETALGTELQRLLWVDVYLTDVNGPRGGPDKRCRVVAHLPAGGPVVVSRMDSDPVTAVGVAAARSRRLIRSRMKRRQDRRRRAVAA